MSFRTVEVSNPAYESDGLRLVTVKSAALGRRADVTIWLPASVGAEPLPVVTLLHGVYGSHWAWSLNGGAHRTARRLIEAGVLPPCVLAMPSDGLWGDGTCYLPHGDADYEAWIADELPALVRQVVDTVTEASPWFIAGLSMGGYGAMRIGAAYPDRFRGISGHSSACTFEQMAVFTEEPQSDYQLALRTPTDVLAAILDNRHKLPPLRFDCGVDDDLIDHNRTLHRQLCDAQIPHQYQEFPGGHSWDYWSKHLEDTLRFFAPLMHHSD